MSSNPDIVHTRRICNIAREITDWLPIDWSKLYAQDRDAIVELRDQVVEEFVKIKADVLMEMCPDLVEHLLRNPGLQGWDMIALAIDNQNGMYHPLRLTKMVMGSLQ